MQGGWGDDSAGGWGEPAAAGSGWGQDNPLAGAADEDDDPLALLGALDDLSIPMPSGGSPMPSEASPSPRLLPPPPPPKQPGFGAPAPAPPAEQVGLPAPPARPDANTASDNTSDPATDTNRANGRNGTLRESFSPSGGNAAAATAPRRPGLFDDSADKSGGGGGGGGGGGAHGAPELTFLFKSNGFPGSMHDQKILNLCYTVLRISTSLLLLLFMVIIVRLASYDDPSAAYDMTRSVLAVLSLGFTTVITIWSQRTMFWRHRGHATRFGLVQQFISVQRTTAERFGRMVFWPIITSFILVILWVLFSYFELIPDRKTEQVGAASCGDTRALLTPCLLIRAPPSVNSVMLQDAWVRRDFSGVGVNKSGWSQFIFYLMIFLIVIQMLLLPVVSWMSLITYEAHMKDPVELLSILLIEEQRLTRKLKLPADGGGDGGPEPLNKRRRPEMAQTRAARLVARGRPPPKALLDRQMKRVETWLAQSLRWRKLLHWVTTGLETLAYYNCYIIHQQIDGKEMAAHASCRWPLPALASSGHCFMCFIVCCCTTECLPILCGPEGTPPACVAVPTAEHAGPSHWVQVIIARSCCTTQWCCS